jgi:hypothetical protein
VRGNPINANDPTGHFAWVLGGAALGAITGAAIYYFTVPLAQQNTTDLLIAAGTGAVAGGLIATGVGATAGVAALAGISSTTAAVATGAGVGMISSQAGYSLGTRLTGDRYSSAEMVGAAAIGGIQGGVAAYIPIARPDPIGGNAQAARFALDMANIVGASLTQSIYNNYVADGSLDFDLESGASMAGSGLSGTMATIAERAVVAQWGDPWGRVVSPIVRNVGVAVSQYLAEDFADDNRRR